MFMLVLNPTLTHMATLALTVKRRAPCTSELHTQVSCFMGDRAVEGSHTVEIGYQNHEEHQYSGIAVHPSVDPMLFKRRKSVVLVETPEATPLWVRIQPPKLTLLDRILKVCSILLLVLFIFSLLTSRSADGKDLQLSVVKETGAKFSDVHGCDEIKASMMEAVAFLKDPSKFDKFGAQIPRGFLFEGPPGTGKTMLAKAVAGEAGVPFLAMSGSEFDEIFVGTGASRIRALFQAARGKRRAVIFIDEFDAIAGKRNFMDSNHSRQTINQLLVEMDGFKSDSGVLVLAATNSVEALDKAVIRPGRFDQVLTFSLPDIEGRKAILQSYINKIDVQLRDADIDAEVLAAGLVGMSGAHLANLVNQAKILAAKETGAQKLAMRHLEAAKDLIMLGPERPMVIEQEEKKNTAHHEAGHALVALVTGGTDPVIRATIVPRSNSLGCVLTAPLKDSYGQSKQQLLARIDVLLAGYLAEEKLGDSNSVTTGASNDLEKATFIARQMVTVYGFGERVGFYSLGSNPKEAVSSVSSETLIKIDQDIQAILEAAKNRVKNILNSREKAWKAIAAALLTKETLSGKELKEIVANN